MRITGLSCFLYILGVFFSPAMAAPVSPARQAELIHLLKQDCGSCHGMTLKGGLGPPLLPKIMAGRPPEALRDIILNGVPDTPMPPWRSELSVSDADWLVHILQHGVPNE